jgi:RpiR family transcriptional regulator, carbohydrate utilization regulator
VSHADLLPRMREALPTLSAAQRRVAETVLNRPHAFIDSNVWELARRAGVSEPTVVRFCRTVGANGFQDFKIKLAQSLVAGVSHLDMGVAADDDAAAYSQKVFDTVIASLIAVRNQLDSSQLERAVDVLARARTIEFYGFVASGAVAVDAQNKFFHFAAPCVAYTDLHMQLMSAAALSPHDVVVAISHTGRTRELLESVRLARESGATVIGVTPAGSPLASVCSMVIDVEVRENTDVYMPTLSRIAHLLVMDVLAVGVALRGGAQAAQRLRRMKSALQARRLPAGSVERPTPLGDEGVRKMPSP